MWADMLWLIKSRLAYDVFSKKKKLSMNNKKFVSIIIS